MRHLGDRVALLVDARMSAEEEERAWAHVHGCPWCADAVQREGWIKRELAGLSVADTQPLPHELRGSLYDPAGFAAYPGLPDPSYAGEVGPPARRRLAGLAVLGAGSLSAAVMGVVALGVAPAEAPGLDLRVPATTVGSSPTTVVATRPREARQRARLTDATELSRLDPGAAARQVAVTVGAGMRMGL